ncbi:MAG: PilD-dependent protein PddA [Planctomycetota bacterium]
MSLRNAFTLVELLIVVVILGILAAVVVPQFSNATNEAMAGNIKSQLRTLQHQVELYMSRNQDQHPINPSPMSGQSWFTLVSQGYLKADPVNPAFTGIAPKTSVWAATTAGARGSGGWAWVWNMPDRVMAASNFNETTGQVTSLPTD